MANIKSAKKRVITNEKKAERNQAVKSQVKTYIKKVDAAVAEGDKEKAAEALKDATRVVEKAATKGVIKKNNASNKVSKMAKRVNSIG